MDAALGGAGSQLAVHAEAFARCSQQGQQEDGESVEQEQAIAPLGIVDPQFAHAHAKAQILCVTKTRFDGPTLAVERDDFPCRDGAVAGRQMPRLFHVLGLHAHHRADLLAGGGDLGVAQFARPAALADPISRQSGFAVGGAHVDVATKADDVPKAKVLQKLEQLDVAKASVGQDRDGYILAQQRFQMRQAGVLKVVALVLQFVLVDREPDERRGPSVVGDQAGRV